MIGSIDTMKCVRLQRSLCDGLLLPVSRWLLKMLPRLTPECQKDGEKFVSHLLLLHFDENFQVIAVFFPPLFKSNIDCYQQPCFINSPAVRGLGI